MRCEKGFTLLELSIALLIFLVGVIALLQLMTVEINTNSRNRDITIATSLAQGEVDDLMRLEFANSALAFGGVIPVPNSNPLLTSGSNPVVCYADFFDYQGNSLGAATGTCGTIATAPASTYFVRQWQICDYGTCGSSCASALSCTATMKKITVTVTALSSAFGSRYPATTIMVYKANP